MIDALLAAAQIISNWNNTHLSIMAIAMSNLRATQSCLVWCSTAPCRVPFVAFLMEVASSLAIRLIIQGSPNIHESRQEWSQLEASRPESYHQTIVSTSQQLLGDRVHSSAIGHANESMLALNHSSRTYTACIYLTA